MNAMTAVPVLPSVALMDWGRHALWAVVLVWALLGVRQLLLSRTAPTGKRLGGLFAEMVGWLIGWQVAAALLVLWTLWPGPASPAFWLGLAFQSPSLVTGGLCIWMIARWSRPASPAQGFAQRTTAQRWLVFAGIALGWVLLLDTLAITHAVVPTSIYAWGFTPWPLWLLLALSVLLWVVQEKAIATIFIATSALFMLARLPNGNIFDAVIDPWLWVALHGLLLSALRRRALLRRKQQPLPAQ